MKELCLKLLRAAELASDANKLTIAWLTPVAAGQIKPEEGYAVVVENEHAQASVRGLSPDSRFFVNYQTMFPDKSWLWMTADKKECCKIIQCPYEVLASATFSIDNTVLLTAGAARHTCTLNDLRDGLALASECLPNAQECAAVLARLQDATYVNGARVQHFRTVLEECQFEFTAVCAYYIVYCTPLLDAAPTI
jgi:hypothetical protein